MVRPLDGVRRGKLSGSARFGAVTCHFHTRRLISTSVTAWSMQGFPETPSVVSQKHGAQEFKENRM